MYDVLVSGHTEKYEEVLAISAALFGYAMVPAGIEEFRVELK